MPSKVRSNTTRLEHPPDALDRPRLREGCGDELFQHFDLGAQVSALGAFVQCVMTAFGPFTRPGHRCGRLGDDVSENGRKRKGQGWSPVALMVKCDWSHHIKRLNVRVNETCLMRCQ